MRWADVPFRPESRVLRQFAGLWLIVFGSIGVWHGLGRSESSVVLPYLVAAVAVGLPGLVRPSLVRPVWVAALTITFPIGWVVSRVLLAIVFYGVVTPLGVVMRLAGHDPLERAVASDQSSYWAIKDRPTDPKSYLRQF
jgi:hypothetical protein